MSTRSTPGSRVSLAAGYVALVALCVLAGWALFALHGSLLDISLALQLNAWVARFLRQAAFPILGLFWLIFVFWLEWYLRRGWQQGRLWRRAAYALAGIAAVAATAAALRAVL